MDKEGQGAAWDAGLTNKEGRGAAWDAELMDKEGQGAAWDAEVMDKEAREVVNINKSTFWGLGVLSVFLGSSLVHRWSFVGKV